MIADFKPILKKPKFLYLWSSQILSMVTIQMMNFLLLTKLYEETGSPIATSLLWVAYSLPALLVGPIGAAAVDLVSRRKTLMITNLLQALTIFAFIFINSQSIFILYAVVLIYSILNQFYVPAEAAYLPSTVSRLNLSQANSLFFITSQASLVIGFGLSGVLERVVGFNGVLIICSVFLFIAFISTSFLDEVKPRMEIPEKVEDALKTFFDTIIEGYTFIRHNKAVLYPLLLLLGIQSSLTIVVVSLPVVAEKILEIPAGFAGISVVVPAGVGAIIGSIFIPRWLRRGVRKKTIIEYSLGVLIFSLLSLTFGIPFLPILYRIMITPLLIIWAGFGFIGVTIPAVTFLQNATPQWLRGRVFGNLYFLTTFVSMFPVLFSGAITEIFGIQTLLVLMALGTGSILWYSRRHGDALIKDSFIYEE